MKIFSKLTKVQQFQIIFFLRVIKNQKQPSRSILRKKCSENIKQIYLRTPMPKCDFNKVLVLVHWCFGIGALLSVCCIFSEHFLKNTFGRLLLNIIFRQYLFCECIRRKETWHVFFAVKKDKIQPQKFLVLEAVTRGVLCKKVFLEISQESTCARVAFLNKVEAQRPATFLRKRILRRCFPVNFVKFLRTSFCIEHTSGGYFCIVLNAKCLTFN